jgi:DMSO reductase anchor subunit
MSLDFLRLLIDFGFVVLIWAVQLIIYPGLGYYSKENLFRWHRSYTTRVTFIVLPLMFSQLILATIQLWQVQNWFTLLSAAVIIILWLLTFLIFVPLHQSIDNDRPVENVCNKLVHKNWMRTVLWTFLFIISVVHYSLNYYISFE